jgi:hypothetical protein
MRSACNSKVSTKNTEFFFSTGGNIDIALEAESMKGKVGESKKAYIQVNAEFQLNYCIPKKNKVVVDLF